LDLLDKLLIKFPNWFKGLLPIGNDIEFNKKNIEKFAKNNLGISKEVHRY